MRGLEQPKGTLKINGSIIIKLSHVCLAVRRKCFVGHLIIYHQNGNTWEKINLTHEFLSQKLPFLDIGKFGKLNHRNLSHQKFSAIPLT